jgi:hypothetical protein
MNVYRTQRESRPCECGGKSCMIPSIRTRHCETVKHRTWRWQRLCEAMLNEALTPAEKRLLLRESKVLLTALYTAPQ